MKIEPSLILLKQKDTEKLKWRKGISNYLQKVYGSQQWNQFYDEKLAKDLDHLRVTANSDLAEKSLLEQNYRYYAYIEQLYLRVGISGSKLNLDFVWYDAKYTPTDTSKKHTQHNIVFEKACTLFNIAYLLIQIAKESLSDDSKTSITNLSKAAGCFQYISTNFLNSPSSDLNSDNTKFLSTVCHAGAQELFLMKLLKSDDSKSKASLISKLALCTSNLYRTCMDMIRDPDTKVKDYGMITWNTNIHFKQLFYQSISVYYYSVTLESQNKIGEAIAFSKLAIEVATSSIPYKSLLKSEFDVDGFIQVATEYSEQLTKDNDYIFHEAIPPSAEVSKIKPMDAIKIPTWEVQLEPYLREVEENANTLFRGIVPMKVYEKESIYSEAKDNILRKENEAIEMADLSFSSFIEFTNLPSLLSDLNKGYKTGNFSFTNDSQNEFMRKQLQSWIQLVKSSSLSDVEKQIEIISARRANILSILKTLPDTERENVVKLKTSLIDASHSDEKLFTMIRPCLPEINLMKDEMKVWNIFNSFEQNNDTNSLLDIDDTKNEHILAKINKVKELYENLMLLKEERSRNFQELKENINSDDITATIIKNISKKDNDLKELFEEELQKFSPWSTRIEATIYRQSSIINEMKIELEDIFKLTGIYDKSSKNDENKEKKNEFFNKIKNSMSNFEIFSTSITKGMQFYDGLQKMAQQLQENTKQTQEISSAPFQPLTKEAPPPLLPKPNSIDSRFANLSIGRDNAIPTNNNNNFMQGNMAPFQAPAVPSYNRPAIPIPNNMQYPNSSTMPNLNEPPLPPKNALPNKMPPSYGDSVQAQGSSIPGSFESNHGQNPTAFYDNPSVFDEDLYSKFSK